MKRVFDRSRTLFEKIFISSIFVYLIAVVIACNVNLDIFVYAGFGVYIILGLIIFIRPKYLFDAVKKENEDFLVRNQRKLPLLMTAFRLAGFTLVVMGAALGYVFIVYY